MRAGQIVTGSSSGWVLTLLDHPGSIGTLGAARVASIPCAALNPGSPGEDWSVLATHPVHMLAGPHCHMLRLEQAVAVVVPLCCQVWAQGAEGVAGAGALAGAYWAAQRSPGSVVDCGLPFMDVATDCQMPLALPPGVVA